MQDERCQQVQGGLLWETVHERFSASVCDGRERQIAIQSGHLSLLDIRRERAAILRSFVAGEFWFQARIAKILL